LSYCKIKVLFGFKNKLWLLFTGFY